MASVPPLLVKLFSNCEKLAGDPLNVTDVAAPKVVIGPVPTASEDGDPVEVTFHVPPVRTPPARLLELVIVTSPTFSTFRVPVLVLVRLAMVWERFSKDKVPLLVKEEVEPFNNWSKWALAPLNLTEALLLNEFMPPLPTTREVTSPVDVTFHVPPVKAPPDSWPELAIFTLPPFKTFKEPVLLRVPLPWITPPLLMVPAFEIDPLLVIVFPLALLIVPVASVLITPVLVSVGCNWLKTFPPLMASVPWLSDKLPSS